MPLRRRFALLSAMLLLLMGLVLGGAMSTLAQDDATPEAETTAETDTTTGDDTTTDAEDRPAHIHTGSCDELGEVVAPFNNLTAPEGDETGQENEGLVQYSFTTVPLTLDAILADDHAVNVHESEDDIENYIACGAIGGVVDANGSLVVTLHELNDSGFSGIAVFSPSAADAASTDVSVFIHQEVEGAGADAGTDGEENDTGETGTGGTGGTDDTDETTDDGGEDTDDASNGDGTTDDATGDDATPDTDA
jgi:hypothetical protein